MRMYKIYCPLNNWGCTYYKDGECGIENPYMECDDFGYMLGDEVPEDDPISTHEVRTAFE